ncbi:Predicted metalloprotease [Pseudonocardia thermophila]|uniref:Predicted metalloprotease n=1 Tax=Pseudonocardia thermophila TaxID=1848 RepID=A0A1M6QG52_PSETH|nr:neutral zinc metallopeptidase [Pseudonocardia thermophila]SHK19037.1 Predicted metalloprotease [Pseudonocardia thermophila]
MDRLSRPAHTWGLVVVLVCALLASAGCAQTLVGRAVPAEDPGVTVPTPVPLSSGDLDEISMQIAEQLQAYWRSEFPRAFGRPWQDLTIVRPAHPDDPAEQLPPCVDSLDEVDNQAFYCPSADAVVWDADGLIPQLDRDYGAPGVVVVLAHEIGHSIQNRLGLSTAARADPQRYPTILLEAQADCYAGVALASFAARPVAGLRIGPQERDAAVLAMIGFRDPLGVSPGDRRAHGNAFDRVSAFQDGYLGTATTCAGMTLDNRTFTQRQFSSADDAARRGDLPLAQLVVALDADAREWFGSLAPTYAPGWQPPQLEARPTAACPTDAVRAQGPASFCPADGSIAIDANSLAPLHRSIGDYSAGLVIASRYALALWTAHGGSPTGIEAGRAALCLSGAYTARLVDSTTSFSLSPGDLDEAVQTLVADTWAGRDAAGNADPAAHGFDRVAVFRLGVLGGPAACFGS